MNKYLLIALLAFPALALVAPKNDHLDLEIRKVKATNLSYLDFCQRWMGECAGSKETIIQWSDEIFKQLDKVNYAVNNQIEFEFDKDQYELEEHWNYPTSGSGDCEDNALEKRRRLVKLGFPRSALRMATAFHSRKFYAHALLLVETTKGTYVLDQDHPKILLWHEAAYIYESRERPNGEWEYFIQEW